MKRSLKVLESAVHGKGLFASNPIKKGVIIGYCRARRARSPGNHTLWVDEQTMWDIVCRLRYINHSKRANVCYFDDLSVVAMRDIQAGEELLHDYGEDW